MRQEEFGAAVRVLAGWNMAPIPPRFPGDEVEATGLEPDRTFVAVHDGRVVGVASFVLAEDGWAHTQSLALDPDWVGQGLGERLQRARLDAMRSLGVRRVRTEADRPDTIAWYVRKFGYRIAGKTPKKQRFGLPEVREWTVLTLEL